MSEQLKIRPYARLLTMLGDQLIKDEVIALIELVKNSYDADAQNVTIAFENFGKDYSITQESKIIIEDDGNGMDEMILKNAWMNPATPEKLRKKKTVKKTDNGRIMQGEKGIGRFAVFKLGGRIQVITRRQKTDQQGHFIDAATGSEYVLTYDFSDYGDDFLSFKEKEQDVFLDELSVSLEKRRPQEIVSQNILNDVVAGPRKPYGTKIIISDIKGKWDEKKIDKVYQNVLRMQPIFGDRFNQDFYVNIQINGATYYSHTDETDNLQTILDEKSVFVVNGTFDSEKHKLEFYLDYHDRKFEYSFKLNDPTMLAISPMREYLNSLQYRNVECGSFGYRFYILDLDISSTDKDTRYYLNPKQVDDVKAHRVYLYRDGIRVMPYGDPDDDWLMLDIIRGTERSGYNFANNQIVGFVSISQEKNPNLRDKTNREGLIEEGHAKEDLVAICQLLLRYLRTRPYAQYLIQKKEKKNKEKENANPERIIETATEELGKKYVENLLSKYGKLIIAEVDNSKNEEALVIVKEAIDRAKQMQRDENKVVEYMADLKSAYENEKEVLTTRIERTENLAAIGLSAETAYHDARILLTHVNNATESLIRSYKAMDADYLLRDAVVTTLEPIRTQINSVTKLMNNVQRLFPSANTRKKDINVNNTLKKVKDLYEESIKKSGIICEIENTRTVDLIVECTDAVLLQVFINLFDNSLYWLKTIDSKREIKVLVDADRKTVAFSDSGPGINANDAPYIFEAFYSGKGEDGKGLGLYIARQLLERYNARIEIAEEMSDKLLEGATFIIRFHKEGE